MDSNCACMLIKVSEKGIMGKMRVCLSSLSYVQAHHTVWRKLRQRAEKLVSATDNTHFLCTHSPQRQQHQSCSAEAKLEEEDCQGLHNQLARSLLNSEWCHWRRRMASSSLWRTDSRFSELHIKVDTDSISRSRQAVFLIPSRSTALIGDICISDWCSQFPSDQTRPSSTSTEI